MEGIMRYVDVRAELEQYEWVSARWTPTRLTAASPFRYERRPSFFVNLERDSVYYGCWGDSGAIDDEWSSGSFPKLLAFLRGETIEETIEYLYDMYAPRIVPDDELPPLRIPELYSERLYKPLPSEILSRYETKSGTVEYLTNRGIAPEVQRLMRVGYDVENRAVVIPWFNPDGSLGNVMYRSIDSKVFWFFRHSSQQNDSLCRYIRCEGDVDSLVDGRPIREMVYGLDVVYRRRIKRAAIVEAPIDAMTIMSAGMAAIATGGTSFGRQKAELIRKSPLEEVVIVRDNDGPGRAWQRRVIEALSGYCDIKIATVPCDVKDVNDAGSRRMQRRLLRAKRVVTLLTHL